MYHGTFRALYLRVRATTRLATTTRERWRLIAAQARTSRECAQPATRAADSGLPRREGRQGQLCVERRAPVETSRERGIGKTLLCVLASPEIWRATWLRDYVLRRAPLALSTVARIAAATPLATVGDCLRASARACRMAGAGSARREMSSRLPRSTDSLSDAKTRRPLAGLAYLAELRRSASAIHSPHATSPPAATAPPLRGAPCG